MIASAPKDALIREQMAVILYRYADYKGYDVGAWADLSDYALDAMRRANAEGLITGTAADSLAPAGSATRAQAATIIKNMIDR